MEESESRLSNTESSNIKKANSRNAEIVKTSTNVDSYATSEMRKSKENVSTPQFNSIYNTFSSNYKFLNSYEKLSAN